MRTPDPRPRTPKKVLGAEGEAAAARFLRKQGLKVVEQNYRSKLGELDLVARDGSRWVFVEVKTRIEGDGDPPQAAVTLHKQRRLARLAQEYLLRQRLGEVPCRFDVVSVLFNHEGRVSEIRHLPAAFSAESW
jgi:putative endonuclease